MAAYRITYKMEPAGEFGDILFVARREISRYSPQEPHDWYAEHKAEWVGKKIVSIEMVV